MKANIEIYALAVCFVSVLCLVVLFGAASYSMFQIMTPEMTMTAYKYDKYQTNDVYWNSRGGVACTKEAKSAERPVEDVLTKQREDAYAVEIKSERRDGFQSLTRSILYSLAAALSFFVHWKLLQNTKTTSSHRSRSSRS
jgi:hypothetical protein